MPTCEEYAQFLRAFAALTPAQQARFLDELQKLANDLRSGQSFRPSLRIKGVQGYPGIFEMTWAPDGRAKFHSGPPVRPGEAHVVWRRIGGHAIMNNP